MPVTVTGLDEVILGLENFKGSLDNLKPVVEDALQIMQDDISTYPVRPPSSYTRTSLYGGSVGIDVSSFGSSLYAVVGPTLNYDVNYAEFVRGEFDGRSPAWMNAPYWSSLNQITDKDLPFVINKIQSYIDGLIEENDL